MGICYVIEKDIKSVTSELKNILAKEIKKDYVKTSWEKDGEILVITIEKMGTSKIEIEFKCDKNSNGSETIKISEKGRKIAMMHKPFAGEVEHMVEDILGNKLGAKRV